MREDRHLAAHVAIGAFETAVRAKGHAVVIGIDVEQLDAFLSSLMRARPRY